MEILHLPSSVLIYGLLFLFIGLYIRYKIGQRKFNRRGIGGIQRFSSYGKAVTTIFAEKLFSLTGTASILAGLFLLLTLWLDHHKCNREIIGRPAANPSTQKNK